MKIDNLAEEILNNEYPASVKESVMKAAAVGNMKPLMEMYNIARSRYYQVQTAQAKTNSGMGNNPLAAALGIGNETQNIQPPTQPVMPTTPKATPPVTESASFGNDVKTPPKQKQTDILDLLGMA